MLRKKSKYKSKEKRKSKQSLYPKNVRHALVVKCKETTFQEELREAKDPNYRLFWTLDRVKSVGDPRKAKRIYFFTGEGERGYFKIKGYGIEDYKGKTVPVVYFHPKFYYT